MSTNLRWYAITDDEIEVVISSLKEANPKLADKLQRQYHPIKRKTAKAKGMAFQKWVCSELSNLLDIPYDQKDDLSEILSRGSGQHGTDVILRGSAYRRFKYDIECKNQESFQLVPTVTQAMENSKKEDRDWLIVHKKKALKDIVVFMSWDAFKRLWKRSNQ